MVSNSILEVWFKFCWKASLIALQAKAASVHQKKNMIHVLLGSTHGEDPLDGPLRLATLIAVGSLFLNIFHMKI